MAPSFLRAFFDTARSVGVDPDRLAVLASHESRFRPDAVNPETRATGLIQFMPATARALGTTVEDLRRMTATEQLPFVARFFAPYHGKLAPRDVILAALGQGIGKPDSTPVVDKEGRPFVKGTIGYKENPGLDTDGDGTITLGDVRAQSDRMIAAAATKPRINVPEGPSSRGVTPSTRGGAPGSGAGVLLFLFTFGAAFAARKVLHR